jgi:hypothetical protein
MMNNDRSTKNSLKSIRDRERKEKDDQVKELCQKLAYERYTEDQVKKWSNENKGIFYLPVMSTEGDIEKLALMRPITREILSYASTKIQEEGLYIFLEAAMRECLITGDAEILDDDEYFIPAANAFNAILEGKKASLLKR